MKRLVFIGLIWFCCLLSAAPATDIHFRHLGIEDGLSQSSVLSLAQDGCGNVWLGTQSGLNCFDGSRFKVFYAQPSDSLALWDDAVYSLLYDGRGTLWIGTATTLSAYDMQERVFRNYTLGSKKVQLVSLLDADDRIYAASSEGVLVFDARERHFLPDSPLLAGFRVRSLLRTEKGEVLAATSRGLYTLQGEPAGLNDFDIASVIMAGNSDYWVGTHGQGLLRVDRHFAIRRRFSKTGGDLPTDYIRVLTRDRRGRLWAGTYDGLALYDDLTGRFLQYQHSEQPESLTHNSIWSLLYDRDGGMWVGTWYGGVNYYHPESNRFQRIVCPSSTYGFVSCLGAEPSKEDLWIGTNDDGLLCYRPATGRFERFYSGNLSGGPFSDNIKCLLPAGNGKWWVGTHLGGVSLLDPQTHRVKTWTINPEFPIYNGCYAMFRPQADTLWLGTNAGLYLFTPSTGSIVPHPKAKEDPLLHTALISTIFKDTQSRYWIGTDGGVVCIYPDGNVSSFVEGNFSVHDIMEDSWGHVRIATNRGLLSCDATSGNLSWVPSLSGIPLQSIMEDKIHMLWMSSGEGLFRWDSQRGELRRYLNRGRMDGNDFTAGAAVQRADGIMYFGGLKGVTRLQPMDILDNTLSAIPVIADVVSGGLPVSVTRDEAGRVLHALIPSSTNVFSIHFSAMNPLSGGKNVYRYQLEGWDRQVQETLSTGVEYANLAPGNYVFTLQSSNSDGRWNPEKVRMTLRVIPAWYQTWWARVLFILAVLLLLASPVIYVFLLRQLKLNSQQILSYRKMVEDLAAGQVHPEEEDVSQVDDPQADEFIRKAVKVVEDNMDNELFGSADFAEAMCLSRSNLYLKMNALTGESAMQFARRIRMARACQLLQEHKYSVAQVSSMVGFSSPSYFTTCFKKAMGVLPTEYGKN